MEGMDTKQGVQGSRWHTWSCFGSVLRVRQVDVAVFSEPRTSTRLEPLDVRGTVEKLSTSSCSVLVTPTSCRGRRAVHDHWISFRIIDVKKINTQFTDRILPLGARNSYFAHISLVSA